MVVKKLSEVLEKLEYTLIRGSVETEIKDVVYDSRKAGADNAFICIIGAVTDGHNYIKSAIDNGCRVFVIQKDIQEIPAFNEPDKTGDITIIQVENTRRALSCMAAAIYDYPAKQLTTVAITGTKGKTTTTFMIRDILENHGRKVGIIGTTGVYMGDKFIEIHNTTPESYEIQRFL